MQSREDTFPKIDKQRVFPFETERRRHVYRRSGLAYAAFLIGKSYYFRHILPLNLIGLLPEKRGAIRQN